MPTTISFTCGNCRKTINHVVPDGGGAAGYAMRDDQKICYPCADDFWRKELLDRTRPIGGCYISGDGRSVTTWTGGLLGRVSQSWPTRCGRHRLMFYRVIDIHGRSWHGRGSGPHMHINLFPTKT